MVTRAQHNKANRKINELGYKILRGEELTIVERIVIRVAEDIKNQWYDQQEKNLS